MPGRIAARARVLYPLTYVYLLAFVITMVCTTWTAALMPKTLTKRPVVLSMALASAWTFADFLGNLCSLGSFDQSPSPEAMRQPPAA